MIFLRLKSKISIFLASLFIFILCVIICLAVINFKNNETTNANLNNSLIPYYDKSICLSIVCEDLIVFADFKENQTNIYSVDLNESENTKSFHDNIEHFAKKQFGITVNRQCVISFDVCEEIIDLCGGISLLNKFGEEEFLQGNEFKETLIKEKNKEYIGYLFSVLLKSIFENETFSYLYKYSNISYIDIANHKEFIKKSLCEITCFESGAIISEESDGSFSMRANLMRMRRK